jgi:hypothetical protein
MKYQYTQNGKLIKVIMVQIQLRSGRKFRLGTDDPQGVIDAFSQNIR